jgi:hypothetical protein
MRLSDAAVESLKEHLTHPFTPKVHIEDTTVYNNGLTDGARMLAEWVLSQLKPEEPTQNKTEETNA